MTAVQSTQAGASANVSAVVRMLLAGRGDKFDVLTEPLGLGRTTTFEKVAGKRRWYAEEVQALADYFGLPITTFYGGPDALFARAANSQGNWPDSYQEPLFFDAHAA